MAIYFKVFEYRMIRNNMKYEVGMDIYRYRVIIFNDFRYFIMK